MSVYVYQLDFSPFVSSLKSWTTAVRIGKIFVPVVEPKPPVVLLLVPPKRPPELVLVWPKPPVLVAPKAFEHSHQHRCHPPSWWLKKGILPEELLLLLFAPKPPKPVDWVAVLLLVFWPKPPNPPPKDMMVVTKLSRFEIYALFECKRSCRRAS